jgi:hypothetical protein
MSANTASTLPIKRFVIRPALTSSTGAGPRHDRCPSTDRFGQCRCSVCNALSAKGSARTLDTRRRTCVEQQSVRRISGRMTLKRSTMPLDPRGGGALHADVYNPHSAVSVMMMTVDGWPSLQAARRHRKAIAASFQGQSPVGCGDQNGPPLPPFPHASYPVAASFASAFRDWRER